jgi:hypothetical protein
MTHGGHYRKPDAKGVPMGLARFMIEENGNQPELAC